MRDRLLAKLFLVLLATVGGVVIAMVLLVRWSIDRGFVEYLNSVQGARVTEVAEALAAFYGSAGSWEPMMRDHRIWVELTRDGPGEGAPPLFGDERPPGPQGGFGPPDRPPPDRFGNRLIGGRPGQLQVGSRLTLFDAWGRRVAGRFGSSEGLELRPIVSGGRTVGQLGVPPLVHPEEQFGLAFLRSQTRAYYAIGAGVILFAGLVALLLARRLLVPVKALARGARELAAGQLAARVEVAGRDELAGLAVDFNHLAATLEANETARRRWVADISHELRTPLAVLRGEIEALQDGIRPLAPAALNSLHGETVQLGKLVEDLYQLALSDLGALTYHMEPLDPVALLVEVGEGFQGRYRNAGLTLALPPPEGPAVLGDGNRLSQLFHNLFENSLRYTDAGGRLQVSWRSEAGRLLIDFQDSAPGVPAEALPRLFDRLYRGEASRNRARGGAGLGLAICANIAQAHHGRIEARASPIGGLWLRLALPLFVTGNSRS